MHEAGWPSVIDINRMEKLLVTPLSTIRYNSKPPQTEASKRAIKLNQHLTKAFSAAEHYNLDEGKICCRVFGLGWVSFRRLSSLTDDFLSFFFMMVIRRYCCLHITRTCQSLMQSRFQCVRQHLSRETWCGKSKSKDFYAFICCVHITHTRAHVHR